MNPETIQLLQSLADQLGTTTDMLWQVLIRQAPISAGARLFSHLLSIILPGMAALLVWRAFEDERNHGSSEGLDIVIFLGIISFAACFLLILSSGQILSGFFNPEFWALNYILQSLPR